MDYSLPRSKSKAEKVEKKIQKKHMKATVDKVLRKHEAGESKRQESKEDKK